VESGLSANEVAFVAELDASVGDDGVEVGKGGEVLVGNGLVDVDPEGFGRLQFGVVGWQIDEADALGGLRGRAVPRKSARVSAKGSLSAPVPMYQKLSPVAGETKTVT
jgi:hypothetical protein